MRAVLLWFLIPVLSYGQGICDMEIIGFNPISTDITIAINGGYCTPEAGDSIGEFLLSMAFNPALDDNGDWGCIYPNGWAYLIFPLNFPGFDIGEGSDQILQTGDTVSFALNEIPTFGSGTAACWIDIMQSGAYYEECLVLSVWQINDSYTLDGSPGPAGNPYPDADIFNSWIMWSLNGACDPPPPPIVYGCTDMFAYNYNFVASQDDGSCIYQGCQDPLALNYCEECEVEGPCIYEPPGGEDCSDPLIFIANTFSPNNDGLNDYWRAVTRAECWLTWELRIYNRWGTLVWMSYDPDAKWIGEKLDAFVPDGVYTWALKAKTYESTKVVDMAGHVTIFR